MFSLGSPANRKLIFNLFDTIFTTRFGPSGSFLCKYDAEESFNLFRQHSNCEPLKLHFELEKIQHCGDESTQTSGVVLCSPAKPVRIREILPFSSLFYSIDLLPGRKRGRNTPQPILMAGFNTGLHRPECIAATTGKKKNTLSRLVANLPRTSQTCFFFVLKNHAQAERDPLVGGAGSPR